MFNYCLFVFLFLVIVLDSFFPIKVIIISLYFLLNTDSLGFYCSYVSLLLLSTLIALADLNKSVLGT